LTPERPDTDHDARTEKLLPAGDDCQTVERIGNVDTETSRTSGPAEKDRAAEPRVGGYDILGTLGQGAAGVVYRARQRGLNRLVALKMISAGTHASATEQGRFRAEAEAAAALQHPNLVQIYEIGEHEGRAYISLELVTGGSLSQKIASTPQPPRYAAEVVRTLALAMNHAHQHKIVHRDLKPANVLLTEDGTPKIADFGLAKSLENDSVHTQTGTILGTPSYMAPEQAEGKTHEIGPPADIYALGAILYDMLTGRPPFRGASLWDTVSQVKTTEPVPPRQLQPGVPTDLETICLKCLHKDATKRYASAADLADDLGNFLAGRPIRARPISAPERLARWCRRNPVLAGLGSLAALGLAAFIATLIVSYFQLKAEKQETDRQRLRAEDNAARARKNEESAINSAADAKAKEQLANKNAAAARQNFAYASALLQNTIRRLQELVEKFNVRLQPRPGQPLSSEAAALRKHLLEVTRETMSVMARDFTKASLSDFGGVLVHQAMGDLLLKLGESEEARQQYQQGTQLMRKFHQERPTDVKVNGNLALMLDKLGEATLLARGDAASAAACFGEAFRLNDSVLKHLPAVPANDEDKRKRAETNRFQNHYYKRLIDNAGLMWQPAESRRWLQGPLGFWKARAQASPKGPEARSYLAQTNSLLGDACSWCGDWKACQEHHEAAIRLCEGLIKDFPRDYTIPADLAFVCLVYGDAHRRQGRLDEAGKLYQKHLADAESALAREPRSVWVKFVLAHAYQRQGALLVQQGQPALAAEPLEKSLKKWEELARVGKNNLSYQLALCEALARSGEVDSARDKVETLLKQFPNRPEALIEAARCFTLCVPHRPADKRALTDKAVALLRQAIAQGYRNPAALATDPDWEEIRSGANFQKLLEQARQAALKTRRSPARAETE
jgi:serine/threonine-protein kinase